MFSKQLLHQFLNQVVVIAIFYCGRAWLGVLIKLCAKIIASYQGFQIFLIAGLILLVAMVGAIVLTLNFKSHRKGEIFSRQLSRSDNFLSFFK